MRKFRLVAKIIAWYNMRMAQLLSNMPRIALMMQRSNAITHRAFLTGVLRYAHMYGPWHCLMADGNAQPDLTSVDGVIGSPFSVLKPCDRRLADIPTVLTTTYDRAEATAYRRLHRIIGTVSCDNAAVGRAAARHFLERKFANFTFIGTPEKSRWSDERQRAFARETGNVHIHRYNKVPLEDWLTALPRPCGLFAANDFIARAALDACRNARLNVPSDIAIVGCDDDELICSTATPQLSSIRMDIESAGFAAARLLDRTLRRGDRAGEPERILYGVTETVVRASSNAQNLGDPLVERAVAGIGLNVTVRFTVRELAQKLNVSTRLLEMRFRRALGRSVRDEIMRQRLLRVKRLLSESTDSLETIAVVCGFASASHLCTAFKRVYETTPSSCRRQS